MNDASGSISGKRKRLGGTSSLIGFGGEGSGDDDDPHKRRFKAVSKTCIESSIGLIREIIFNILAETTNQSLRSGLNNPHTKRWNRSITQALEERFG
jgi:hypothetical protein